MRRSLAGPLALVLLGVLFLIINFRYDGLSWNIVSTLFRFWPLALVAVGLSIVISSQREGPVNVVGWVFVALLAMLIIAVVAAPGRFERWGAGDLVDRSYASTLEENQAADAEVRIDLDSATVSVTGGGESLFAADAHYSPKQGPYELAREWVGKTIRLNYRRVRRNHGFIFTTLRERHNITLGTVPMKLEARTGSGRMDVRPGSTPLRELDLRAGSGQVAVGMDQTNASTCDHLRAEVGSGELTVRGYGKLKSNAAELRVGSGSISLETDTLMPGDNDLRIEVGSGVARVSLPAGAAYRVRGNIGSGSIRIGGVRYSRRDFDRQGIIESPGYGNAASRIEIVVRVGSGSVDISF